MSADRHQAHFAGRHVLAEFERVDPKLLDDLTFLQQALAGALRRAGATVCDLVSHRFAPHGVTVLALLAESHASVHSYPELGTAFVDVFTCGDAADPERAVELLAKALGADPVHVESIARGHNRLADTGAFVPHALPARSERLTGPDPVGHLALGDEGNEGNASGEQDQSRPLDRPARLDREIDGEGHVDHVNHAVDG